MNELMTVMLNAIFIFQNINNYPSNYFLLSSKEKRKNF